ncbi:MAG TPA: ferrochelatase [Acetobacteraceae bacterium]|nr:ferrochelatase [Acetobacteraceae bacterium]
MPADQRRRVAVVLFNLGGPDRLPAIRPFLLNLFRDPAILRVPLLLRFLLGRAIAYLRLPAARANYALLDGCSPLLDLTRAQARTLQAALPDMQVRCFVAMRYWHPFSDAAAGAVRAWRPDDVVLLPLYPQFSTTTTGSSLAAWQEAAAKAGLVAATHMICCYAAEDAYVASVAALVRAAYAQARSGLAADTPLRVLFSAHGLPEAIISSGDPYRWQVEQTVAAVLNAWKEPLIDWVICYQSRATPVRWIGPSTISEIERAARDRVAVMLVPIAFVSEHSETLVELDVEYRHLADRLGVPGYFRVPAPNSDTGFIAALARGVRRALALGIGTHSHRGPRACPRRYSGCLCRVEDSA